MTSPESTVSQTRSFSTVFMIEMWERFGFYGMQVLMVTYMMKKLGLRRHARQPGLGRRGGADLCDAGDRRLGRRQAARHPAHHDDRRRSCWRSATRCSGCRPTTRSSCTCALGVIIVGNGFFKPNAGNLVRKIYEGDDTQDRQRLHHVLHGGEHRLDDLDDADAVDPRLRRRALRRLRGLAHGVRRLLDRPGARPDQLRADAAARSRTSARRRTTRARQPQAARRACSAAASAMVFISIVHPAERGGGAGVRLCRRGRSCSAIFINLIRISHRDERAGLIAALVLVVADHLLLHLLPADVHVAQSVRAEQRQPRFQAVRLAPVHLDSGAIPESQLDLDRRAESGAGVHLQLARPRSARIRRIAAKFAWGFAAVAVGFFIYGVGARWAVDGQVSSWIMVWGYGLYSLGELLVSGLGLAMIARYVPARMGGFMMGAYFVASGLSQYLGSVVANFAHIPRGPRRSGRVAGHLHQPVQQARLRRGACARSSRSPCCR